MYTLSAFLANDRRHALAAGKMLPEQMVGSVLFADISGFTALTEAVIHTFGEKSAVDQLTVQINQVFAALIAIVERFDGDVVGFGGDALTCWFRNDEGLRAVSCAQMMQSCMTQFAACSISVDQTVALSLKIGIATGLACRFAIGDPTIQLLDVMAGSASNELKSVLRDIQPGEVRVGPSVLQRIGEKLLYSEQQDAHYNVQQAAVVKGVHSEFAVQASVSTLAQAQASDSDQFDEQRLKSWLLRPIYERIRNGQGRFLNEIRPVVVLFLKFDGLDYVTDISVGQKLDAYIRWVQQTLVRYHGFLIKLTVDDKGSYMLATFGAPEADEDDVEHAAMAALELRHSSGQFSFITSVQIGIHRGRRVLTGAFGNHKRAAYDILGSAANLANRLMVSAAPNQIIVSKRIVESTASKFTYGDPMLTPVKGASSSMYLFELLAPLTQSPRHSSFAEPIIGRDNEMKQISQLLDRVFAGQGQLLAIEGEAGVGKSRLVAEAIQRSLQLGCQVVTGTSDRLSHAIAYYPWRQLVSSLSGIHNHYSISFDPILAEFLGWIEYDPQAADAQEPQRRQEEIFARISELLLTQSQKQPLVLVLEDIHWMDPTSLALLNVLIRVITQAPILIVITLRPYSGGRQELVEPGSYLHVHQLRLDGLSSDSIHQVVQRRLQGMIHPLVVSVIEARSQGNPFYAEELALAMRETELIVSHANQHNWVISAKLFARLQQANCLAKEPTTGAWIINPAASLSAVDLGAPEKLHQLVLSRLDRVPETCRPLIYLASVIGRTFALDLLEQAYDGQPSMGALSTQLALLQTHQMIICLPNQYKTSYAFRHHITQEVTYDSMVEGLRQELHQAVGLALEVSQPEAVELLAYHFSRTRQREKGLHYLGAAAVKTLREFANQAALNYYDQALTLEPREEWLLGKVEVAHRLGLRDIERKTLLHLQTWPNVPPALVAYRWAQYYEATSEYELAKAEIQRTLEQTEAQSIRITEARCWALLGLAARRVGKYEQAKEWSRKALAQLDQGQMHEDDRSIRVNLYNNLSFANLQQGNYAQTSAYGEQALTLCRQIGHRKGETEALTSLGLAAYYQRDFATSLQLAQQAIQLQRTIGDLAGEGVSLYNLALSLYELARYEEAESNCLAALQIHQTMLNRREETNVRNLLGYLYYLQGDFTGALAEMESAFSLAKAIGDEASEVYLLGNLGMLVRDHGQLSQAATYLEECTAFADKQGDKHALAMGQSHLAIVRLQQGNCQAAVRLAESARQIRQEIGADALTTIDLTTMAEAYWLLEKHQQAIAYVNQTLTLLKQAIQSKPEFPQRDYFICFQLLQRAGQHVAARNALQAAHAIVMKQAEGYKNYTRRHAFLTRVPQNQAIITAYQQL